MKEWQTMLDGASSKRKSTFKQPDFNRANFELLKERIINLERQMMEMADIIGEQVAAFETAIIAIQKSQREQEETNTLMLSMIG